MSIVLLIAGIALILWGADLLTDGASAVAKRMGVSDLIVGLTVVAFGTSAPELCISILSAANSQAAMAIGNVVGSNIFNVLVIIGVTAMVRPIVVEKSVLSNEIPLMLLSSLALLAIGASPWLGAGPAEVSRVDGLLLLLFFMVFMRYTFAQAKHTPNAQADPSAEQAAAIKPMPLWRSIVYVVGGLAMLVEGGNLFVDGASAIASWLGVSDAVIGLTIVAAGTSLPELAASVAAALKGRPGIAVGNVIGSNIFNAFLVLGTTATIIPLPFGGVSMFDLLTMTVATLLFWAFGWWFGNKTILRGEGAVLVLCYILYVAVLISQAT